MTTASPPAAAPSAHGYLHYLLARYPRQVRLETSSRCSMRCMMCHAHGGRNPASPGAKKMARPMQLIDDGLFEQAVRELASWQHPLREVVPTTWGEWFLHPRWFEQGQMIDALLPQTRLVLPTTGGLVTDDVLVKLASLKTLKHLNISVNAFFKETYERVHGVSAECLERVISWVPRFRNMRPDVWVQVSMVYDPVAHGQSEMERDLFRQFWAPQVNAVEVNTTTYSDHPASKRESLVTLPCRSIFDGIVLFEDGRVVSGCCFDAEGELEIGKFPAEKLLDIWRGPKLRALGDLHNSGRRNEIGICKFCAFA